MSSTITQVNELDEYLTEINKVINGEGSTYQGWYVYYPQDQILLKFDQGYSVDENEGNGIWKDGFLLVGFVSSDKNIKEVIQGLLPTAHMGFSNDNIIYYEGRIIAFEKYDGMIIIFWTGGQPIGDIDTPTFVQNLVDKIEDSTL